MILCMTSYTQTMTDNNNTVEQVERKVQSKIRDVKRSLNDAQGDIDRRDFIKSVAIIGGTVGATVKYTTREATAEEGNGISSSHIARSNTGAEYSPSEDEYTDADVYPEMIYIDDSQTEITVTWDDLFEREELKLFFYLSGEGYMEDEISADIGDDLSFAESGDGTDLRSPDDNGVTFENVTEDGSQTFHASDIFGDAENGGMVPLDRHAEVEMEDFRVYEGNEMVDSSEVDDYHISKEFTIRVELYRMETGEVITEGESDPFEIHFGLQSGFGHHFGHMFGREYAEPLPTEHM